MYMKMQDKSLNAFRKTRSLNRPQSHENTEQTKKEANKQTEKD